MTAAQRLSVALLAEGVDRNRVGAAAGAVAAAVALLAEGVDRNIMSNHQDSGDLKVALFAEGVDRNGSALCFTHR